MLVVKKVENKTDLLELSHQELTTMLFALNKYRAYCHDAVETYKQVKREYPFQFQEIDQVNHDYYFHQKQQAIDLMNRLQTS